MKKLSAPPITGITIDEKIQLEDSFATLVDSINQKIKENYEKSIFSFNYKPNSSDTKGLSVIVEMPNEWKSNYKWCVDQVNTNKNLTYDMEKNLLSLTQTQTTTPADTTKTTTAAPSTSNSSSSSGWQGREAFVSAAYGGGIAQDIQKASEKALAEEVKRMKNLMTL
jgi:hypothetical protein